MANSRRPGTSSDSEIALQAKASFTTPASCASQPAIISGNRHKPQASFVESCARAAEGLRQLGIGPGDTVGLFLRNDIAFLEASVAAGLLGAYPVALNWHWTQAEAQYVFSDCAAKVVVIHRDLLQGMRGALTKDASVIVVETPPEIAAAYSIDLQSIARTGEPVWDCWLQQHEPIADPFGEPPGAMIYTSGTTGRPKGVRRDAPTPSQAVAAARLAERLYGLSTCDEDAVILVTAPMYHSAPNAMGMNGVRSGGSVILQPKFDAEETLRLIAQCRVTHAYFAPIMFNRLLHLPQEIRATYDLSSLKFVVHAAAPCPPEIKQAMIAWWGPVIHEFYGCTEARAVTVCSSQEWLDHPGTVGRVMPGAMVRIVDAEGKDLPPGQAGEVICGNPEMADFTYQNDQAKRDQANRDGLFAIGDIGYLDDEGYLFICDRSSDMIISGGVNIYPAEIEAELVQLPGVSDCAVFGIPDAEFGEAVMAVVQPADGPAPDPGVLRRALRERLAGYKVPRRIEIMVELPREDSGKIMKRKLREGYWSNEKRRI